MSVCAQCQKPVKNRMNGGVLLHQECDRAWFDYLWSEQTLVLPRCCEAWNIETFYDSNQKRIEWCAGCGALRIGNEDWHYPTSPIE
jgi:hypothetical protein